MAQLQLKQILAEILLQYEGEVDAKRLLERAEEVFSNCFAL